MSIHDGIADGLTIIRNGVSSRKKSVELTFSTKMANILTILKEEGFISNFKKEEVKGKAYSKLRVELKYVDNKSVIEVLKRISTPGLRVYRSVDAITSVRNGFGIAIISTSKGMMTDKEARAQKVGGEVICHVW